jgi:hypothetical protein
MGCGIVILDALSVFYYFSCSQISSAHVEQLGDPESVSLFEGISTAACRILSRHCCGFCEFLS